MPKILQRLYQAITIAQAQKILAAVGESKTPKIPIEAVARKISFWFDHWIAMKELDDPARRRAFKDLRKVEAFALKISKLLEADSEAPHIFEFLEEVANLRAFEFEFYRDLGQDLRKETLLNSKASPLEFYTYDRGN